MSSNYELKIFPIENDFIASIEFNTAPEIIVKQPSKIATVIILDRSGSMGKSVYKIVHSVLPLFFENLSYDDDAEIHLIAFESRTKLYVKTVKEFKNFKLSSAGGTSMSPAVTQLHELFTKFEKEAVTSLRILTISDGEVWDQAQTKELGDKLSEYAGKINISVNSQAVRFFTSRSQPDTTAICSLLQLNNVGRSKLTDVDAVKHHQKIAKEMAELFTNDGFDDAKVLTCNDAIFYKFPWDETAVNQMLLLPNRRNVFWLDNLPKDTHKLTINGENVKITIASILTLDMFQLLLNSKLDFIIDRMKILKVVNTENAKLTIEKIVEYFTRIENIMASLIPDEPIDPKSLDNRARILKLNAIRARKVSTFLATIANDEHVEKLNAAQKAEYLRSVQASSKAGRGLAKRASKGKKKIGATVFSFDEIVRKQVLDMKAHFDEIKDIDYKNHSISFYSHATTMEGIKSVIEFADDPQFNNFDANEILQILNLVGVACSGPISDFPDASSWRVSEIYAGCYVSVADIITAIQQSGDSDYKLRAPGIEKEITNVIPVFDDDRIGVFLKKYAPSILEYASSIGMRRLIADVSMTFGFTIIAGIRRLMYDLNKNKTTAHMETFKSFVTSAASFVGKYYDHTEELIADKDVGVNAYYLANNGIANMIVPLIRVHNKKNHKIANILRSIYSCEVWKGVSKEFRGKVEFDKIVKEMMDKLLSIDYDKHKVQVQQPFTPEPEKSSIIFHDQFTVNQEYLDKLSNPLYYHNYMTLLPAQLEAAINGPIEKIKDIPEMTKASVLEVFDINYHYNDFIFFNIYQALRYSRSSSRADSNSKTMKIIDVKHKDLIVEDIKSYVRKQFENLYDYKVKMKIHKEESELASRLVTAMINETKIENLIAIWKDGIKYKGKTYKLANSSSIAFKILSQKLLNAKMSIPLRAEIIKILILSKHDSQVIYNSGIIADVKRVTKFKKSFFLTRSIDEWNEIEEKYKNRGVYKYREKENRHGHGNEKPSYYGLGYAKLIDYFEEVVADDDNTKMYEYRYKHLRCCSVYNAESIIWDRQWQKQKKKYEEEEAKRTLLGEKEESSESSDDSSDEEFKDAEDEAEIVKVV